MIIKPCCQEGIYRLPKMVEEYSATAIELKFCPWCAQAITLKSRIEVIAREYNEKTPHPPNNWRVEVEFNLDSKTTAWFVMNGSDGWFDQLEANARVQLVRNFLSEIENNNASLEDEPVSEAKRSQGGRGPGSFEVELDRLCLEREAALILEQEGWIIERTAHETSSPRRMRDFGARYRAWQDKVNQFRAADTKQTWPKPPDNS